MSPAHKGGAKLAQKEVVLLTASGYGLAMYEPHPSLKIPSDDAAIWRYLDLPKVVSMLSKRSLYFSRTSELGDPFEGVLPHAMLSEQQHQHALRVAEISMRYEQRLAEETDIDRQETIRRELGVFLAGQDSILVGQYERWRYTAVSCWHVGECESDAMWKVYGPKTGVAIRSTVGRLKEALAVADERVFIAKVEYWDYDDPNLAHLDGWNNHLVPLFWKRNHFKHEQELRCALYARGGSLAARLVRDPGIGVPVDLDILIEGVRVAPAAGAWYAAAVDATFKSFALPRVVEHSAMDAAHPWSGGKGNPGWNGVIRGP